MTKLVLYTEGNVISTRKNGLFDLENRLKVIFNLLRKATSIEKSYKLNPFKKVVFSFIMAASFFGSIHLANERYVEYKKNPKNIIQYNQNIFRNEEEESCNIKTELNYPMFTNVNQKDFGKAFKHVARRLGIRFGPTSAIDYVPRFGSTIGLEPT